MSRDRPRHVSLPPSAITDPKIKSAAAKYGELRQREVAARHALIRQQDAREQAVQSDRQAFADSVRAGKADPGPAAVRAADAAIETARREVEALEIATDDQQRDLVALVKKNRAEWQSRIDERTREARTAYAEAVQAVGA